MKFNREAKRGFGKASVSLLAITLMTFGPIAGARAESGIDELMGASAEKVSNQELAEQRGGFMIRGMLFNIALEKRKTVNGQLQYFSRLVADNHGWQETVWEHQAAAAKQVGPNSTANTANTAPQTPPSGAPAHAPTPPVATIAGASLPTSTGAGPSGGGTQSTAPGGPGAGAAILGGVELVVDAVTPPPVPDVTSVVANNLPDTLNGTAPQAPEAATIPGGSPAAIPGTELANASGTGSPAPLTTGDAPHSGSTNPVTPGVSDVGEVPQSAGASVSPASHGSQNVQILGGNQPLTNETVRRLLNGPTVVVNDKNNVSIQEYTSITVDVSNFSSITADAIRGHLAASIADLIRTQTANSLSGF